MGNSCAVTLVNKRGSLSAMFSICNHHVVEFGWIHGTISVGNTVPYTIKEVTMIRNFPFALLLQIPEQRSPGNRRGLEARRLNCKAMEVVHTPASRRSQNYH